MEKQLAKPVIKHNKHLRSRPQILDDAVALQQHALLDAAVRVVVAREDRGRVRGVAGPQDVGRLGAARVARREDVAVRRGVPQNRGCLLYTSPSPRDKRQSRMPSSA